MPQHTLTVRSALAFIDESRCIGCTLCIQACPVDAIVGATTLMHTVIAAACIGCKLCVPPCPVDCIEIQPIAPLESNAHAAAQALAHRRAHARVLRLERLQDEKAARTAAQREARRKRATITKVLERARLRLDAKKIG